MDEGEGRLWSTLLRMGLDWETAGRAWRPDRELERGRGCGAGEGYGEGGLGRSREACKGFRKGSVR